MFPEELGSLKSAKAHIQVPEGVIPRYSKPKPLVCALQGPVIKKIEWLQAVGTIVPVTHFEWAAHIVSMEAFEYA